MSLSGSLRSALRVGVCALLSVASAAAQTTSSASMPLPRAFVGVGAGPSTNDAASRMRLYEEGLAAVWLVEAGAAVSERVGIGVEYSQPSVATAFTTIGLGRAQSAGRQEERVLLVMVRARLAGMNRWALDVVGGAGILFQHHESGRCEPAQIRCEDTDDRSLDERAPAFAIGLDIPVRVARHLEVAGEVRAYFLRRGEHTSESDINLSWQYEWQSSTRAAAVIVRRVVW
jgi:hypothetical protein